jgi:hypothetical protein
MCTDFKNSKSLQINDLQKHWILNCVNLSRFSEFFAASGKAAESAEITARLHKKAGFAEPR